MDYFIILILFCLFNLFFSQFNNIIDINSFDIYSIQKNQKNIIFRYNYISEKKKDIIIYISPKSKENALGQLSISTDLDLIKQKVKSNQVKNISFNYHTKKSMVINKYESVNIGKNNYYILLSGNIYCDFEIFLSNEIREIFTNNSYYFPSLNNLSTDFISLRLNSLKKNIYLNILKINKSCNTLKIYKNDDELICNEEISQYRELNGFYSYTINVYYLSNNSNDDLVLNFMDSIVQNILRYNNNLMFIDNSEFYFYLKLNNYELNSTFGVVMNYDSRCRIQIYYLSYLFDYKIPDIYDFEEYDYIEYNEQNSFLLNYYNKSLNYALIKIQINNYLNIPLKIKLFFDINYINEIPFKFFLEKGKYFFVINNELKEKYYNIKNYFLFKLNNSSNEMIAYTDTYNTIIKTNFFNQKINDVISIYFNIYIEDEFQIYPISSELNNKILFYKNIFQVNEKFFVFDEGKNELTEIIQCDTETVIYFNLIIGDSLLYLIDKEEYSFNNLNQIPDENKKIINGLEIINDKRLILKYKINSFSICEYFIQQNDILNDIISFEPKIKYFRRNFIYQININLNVFNKILIKLLNTDKNITIYNNNSEFVLNSKNMLIYLNESGNYFIKGYNSIVAFYTSITNNNNFSICNEDYKNFKNVQEIFIIPNATDFDSINIFITYYDNNINETYLNYIFDYNRIPFTRKNFEFYKRLNIKNSHMTSIIIENYYKGNKIKFSLKEKLFIYFGFKDILSKVIIEIKYSNYNFLSLNNNIVLKSGFNKVFLGYEYYYYLQFDLCENKEISYSFVKNEINELNETNIITSNKILSLKNDYIDDFYSVYINNEKEIVLSLSNNEIKNNSFLNYDYSINIKYVNNEKKELYIEFNPISYYPEVEYSIFILESKYFNKTIHFCSFNHFIEDSLYLYKDIIVSNGDELAFNLNIKLENIAQNEKEYGIIIMAKEILNNYPNYKFYKLNKFQFINESHEQDQAENNTTIILAIVIPIIMLLLIGAIVFLFIRRKKMKHEQEEEELINFLLIKKIK